MIKTTTWWFAIEDEESDLCGEEFLVEVETEPNEARAAAKDLAARLFPNESPRCYGRVSDYEAEAMGLDTYTE